MSGIAERLGDVRKRMAEAAGRVGRDVSEITLVAVSKTHSAAKVAEAIAAGALIFGENKVQEAAEKISDIDRSGTEWHLIGHLQSNKARKAVQTFDVIQTLDSIELARRLDRICIEEGREKLQVYIQVDLGGEATKSGIARSKLAGLIDAVRDLENIDLKGLMTLPPYFENTENARPFFAGLRKLRDEYLPGGGLSMGMSHDLETAIQEGSTLIRVGTAIFGER